MNKFSASRYDGRGGYHYKNFFLLIQKNWNYDFASDFIFTADDQIELELSRLLDEKSRDLDENTKDALIEGFKGYIKKQHYGHIREFQREEIKKD